MKQNHALSTNQWGGARLISLANIEVIICGVPYLTEGGVAAWQ